MRNTIIFYFVLGILLLQFVETAAQFDADYSIIPHDSKKAKILTKALAVQGAQKSREIKATDTWLIEHYEKVTHDLITQVRDEQIILDDSIQSFLDNIVNKLTENYNLNFEPKRVLILRNPNVNARCIGEGTIILNNGLIAKVKTKNELAFAIAHEVAHLELGHVEIVLKQRRTASITYNPKKEVNKIIAGKSSLKGLNSIKSWAYNVAGFSREMEFQADSLGLVIYKNSYGHDNAAIQALNALDSALFPWYPLSENLFAHFDFEKFPFNPNWTMASLSIYSKKPSRYLHLEIDSINTHPNIQERKQNVRRMLSKDLKKYGGIMINESEFDKIRRTLQFENLNSGLKSKSYDLALFNALQLKSVYPNNSYVSEMIASILLDVGNLKRDNLLKNTLSPYTIEFSEDLRQANNFIFNTSDGELFELAYHFLNNQTNFNKNDQEHYYLLWQICRETGREKVQKSIRETYSSRYKDGKYLKEMK